MLSCLATLALFTAGDVLIVDPNGLGDTTTIQEAVDIANDGDTILVRPLVRPDVEWGYPPFTIIGKSLAIHATGPGLHYTGAVTVRDLPEGSVVTLSGLDVFWPHSDIEQQPGLLSRGLVIEHCLGAVRLQNLRVSGYVDRFDDYPDPSTDAVYISWSSDVVFQNCTLVAGPGDPGYGSAGARALVAENSNVTLYGCEVAGGMGGFGGYLGSLGRDGGDAVRLTGGTLYARGSRFVGGRGGPAQQLANVGAAGAGLWVGPAASAATVDCDLVGGPGAFLWNDWNGADAGPPGPAFVGNVSDVPGPRVTFDGPTLIYGSERAQLRFEGEPGDQALLIVSSSTTFRSLGPSTGVQHVPARDGMMPLGSIPPSGILEIDYLPTVPPGPSGRLYLQGGFEAPEGTVRLADTIVLEVLDAGFQQACPGRIYVDASAADGGDGSSWATAYRDLDMALARAPRCEDTPIEVWIAAGTYTPPRNPFFAYLPTHLYGGFRGDETSLGQRNLDENETILSAGSSVLQLGFGDSSMWWDFGSTFTEGRTENCIVDGFTFTGSNSTACWSVGEARFERCCFEGNRRGMSALGDPRVVQCSFVQNSGRGLIIYSTDDPPLHAVVSQSLFAGNVGSPAQSDAGGGLSVSAIRSPIDVRITGCTFVGNAADGGLLIRNDDLDHEVRVENSIFWANQGSQIQLEPMPGSTALEPDVVYCCVQGWNGTLGGVGNFGLDPRFRSFPGADGVAGTADDDLTLMPSSPCIDAGSNALLPADLGDLDGDGDRSEPLPIDLRGHPRVVDIVLHPLEPRDAAHSLDLGVFESPPLLPATPERR